MVLDKLRNIIGGKMIDIKNLTDEEKKQIYKEIKEEEEKKQKEVEEERENYKNLIELAVKGDIEKLKELSKSIAMIKKDIFNNFESIIGIKRELFDVRETQRTHTFSIEDSGITLGYRMIDNFDDTVHAGVEKIKNWVYGLAEGNKRNEMQSVIDILLKKDKNGNLKASRVLELKQLAERVNDEGFTDGVRIIEKAYKPIKSSYFIEAYEKDKTGKKMNIPLSISAVPLME